MKALILESLMLIFLDAAMLMLVVQLARLARTDGKNLPHARLISAAMGVGFLLGTLLQVLNDNTLLVYLNALGFMLSYTAFLFSVWQKKPEGKK